jgi:hypothetical protein
VASAYAARIGLWRGASTVKHLHVAGVGWMRGEDVVSLVRGLCDLEALRIVSSDHGTGAGSSQWSIDTQGAAVGCPLSLQHARTLLESPSIGSFLRVLDIRGVKQLPPDAIVSAASRCAASLTELNLNESDAFDRCLSDVAALNCAALTSLSLASTGVTLNTLEQFLRAAPGIRTLDVASCRSLEDGIGQRLADLPPSLTCLNLNNDLITVADLQHVGQLRDLTSLDLAEAMDVDDAGIASLAGGLSRLTRLNLHGWAIRDSGVAHVCRMSTLRTLILSGAHVTNDGLAWMAGGLRGLTSLTLKYCGKISDIGIASIASLPQLRELAVPVCRGIRDDGFESIARMPRLTWLDLSNNFVSLQAVKHLCRGPASASLIRLNLAYTGTWDEGLQMVVSSLTRLEFLDVSSCNTTSQVRTALLATRPLLRLWPAVDAS